MLHLMHPKMRFAFVAARAYCYLNIEPVVDKEDSEDRNCTASYSPSQIEVLSI